MTDNLNQATADTGAPPTNTPPAGFDFAAAQAMLRNKYQDDPVQTRASLDALESQYTGAKVAAGTQKILQQDNLDTAIGQFSAALRSGIDTPEKGQALIDQIGSNPDFAANPAARSDAYLALRNHVTAAATGAASSGPGTLFTTALGRFANGQPVTKTDQLSMLAQGALTPEGYGTLSTLTADPTEARLINAKLIAAHAQFSSGPGDVEGNSIFIDHFLPTFLSLYQMGRTQGKALLDLLNPDSNDEITQPLIGIFDRMRAPNNTQASRSASLATQPMAPISGVDPSRPSPPPPAKSKTPILDEIKEGFGSAPLGMSEEDLGKLGLGKDNIAKAGPGGRQYMEMYRAMVQGATSAGDAVLRSMNAAAGGGLEAGVEGLEKLGVSESDAEGARNEFGLGLQALPGEPEFRAAMSAEGRGRTAAEQAESGASDDAAQDSSTAGTGLENSEASTAASTDKRSAATGTATPRGVIVNDVPGGQEFGAVQRLIAHAKQIGVRVMALRWGEVPENVVSRAKELGFGIGGYDHVMSSDVIQHVLKGGGPRGNSGQFPVKAEDLADVPRFIATTPPEGIALSRSRDGQPALTFTQTTNGITEIVEEVRTRRGQLAFKTMHRYREGGGPDAPNVPTGEPDSPSALRP